FEYTDGTPVLSNINFSVKRGETIAIIGPNGSGKSTLLNLIPRFYEPTVGAISFDQTSIDQYDLSSYRDNIGLVTQQPFLFDDTIANNILYGTPKATETEMKEAARKAHATPFIEKELSNGYETCVGEKGARLSGGQCQRIALARAILRNPQIFLLDEATSQIDPESEKLIGDTLQKFVQNRTTFMITHKMSTLTLADRILILKEGRQIDFGTHEELLNRCPLYQNLRRSELKNSA
ncbi:MAG: ATP-binding cassette domain-containing protein, partial [Pirellulaceae bacterium]|nr:ATP-binding cassette domain-containing protein [Pirellulaceae bacterium]